MLCLFHSTSLFFIGSLSFAVVGMSSFIPHKLFLCFSFCILILFFSGVFFTRFLFPKRTKKDHYLFPPSNLYHLSLFCLFCLFYISHCSFSFSLYITVILWLISLNLNFSLYPSPFCNWLSFYFFFLLSIHSLSFSYFTYPLNFLGNEFSVTNFLVTYQMFDILYLLVFNAEQTKVQAYNDINSIFLLGCFILLSVR